jgi:methylated-DNA-[protein]-cysteine S-methyltransferase
MQKLVKYVIFKTRWGYFGLLGTENTLWRTQLPTTGKKTAKTRLLKNLPTAHHDKNLFKPLQKQIIAYFKGSYVNFSEDIPLEIHNLSPFAQQVLKTCRDIKLGQKISYSQLAEKIGKPSAARAVGSCLAKNPVPLIIPCHRVIRSDGSLGGFSAPGGGISLKKKLLLHEKCFDN